MLHDGSVKIVLKFWFRPVWLSVVHSNTSSYCIDEVRQSERERSSFLHDPEASHRNEILIFCDIWKYDDYVRQHHINRLLGSNK